MEVRQARGASVSSLASGVGSRGLPPVQEDEVLLSGESPVSATAPPPRSLGSAQVQLAHPEYKPTPLSTQTLSLLYLMTQWNVSMPKNACCWLHGALHCLDTMRNELSRRPCKMLPENMFSGQCDNCGLLKMDGQSSCEFCEGAEASSFVDGPTHSEDAFTD